MFTLVFAVMMLAMTGRFAGEAGGRRIDALRDERAQAVYESLVPSTFDWLIVVWAAAAAVNVALGIYLGSALDVAVHALALVILIATLGLRPVARATVIAAFTRRGLRRAREQETSARRQRRLKQFGSVALAGYLVDQVCLAVAPRTSATWPGIVQSLATLMVVGGGFALLWTMAWRFGDERRL